MVMGCLSATRSRIVLKAIIVSTTCVAAGFAAGIGSARPARAQTASGCKQDAGEVVTLRLKAPTQTVRADVGDTIRVVAHLKGSRMSVPKPVDHKQAVCRISWHRVSASKVIATFRARRTARKITFESKTVTSHKRCPPDSHGRRARGCPAPFEIFGYARIGVPGPASTY